MKVWLFDLANHNVWLSNQVGDFSNEVMKSLGKIQQPRIMPRMGVPVAPPRVGIPREPDSGISSARSTTTVPWSHNDSDIPQLAEESGEAEHQFWLQQYC